MRQVSEAAIPIWATDVAIEGVPISNSADHFDLVVSTDSEVLPDTYATADKGERRRLRGLLRPQFLRVLSLFSPPQPFDLTPSSPS